MFHVQGFGGKFPCVELGAMVAVDGVLRLCWLLWFSELSVWTRLQLKEVYRCSEFVSAVLHSLRGALDVSDSTWLTVYALTQWPQVA
jgi:hypothetical protein